MFRWIPGALILLLISLGLLFKSLVTHNSIQSVFFKLRLNLGNILRLVENYHFVEVRYVFVIMCVLLEVLTSVAALALRVLTILIVVALLRTWMVKFYTSSVLVLLLATIWTTILFFSNLLIFPVVNQASNSVFLGSMGLSLAINSKAVETGPGTRSKEIFCD